MVNSVQMLKNFKKDITNITLKDIYEILSKKMLNLVSFFTTTYDSTKKKRWIKFF